MPQKQTGFDIRGASRGHVSRKMHQNGKLQSKSFQEKQTLFLTQTSKWSSLVQAKAPRFGLELKFNPEIRFRTQISLVHPRGVSVTPTAPAALPNPSAQHGFKSRDGISKLLTWCLQFYSDTINISLFGV